MSTTLEVRTLEAAARDEYLDGLVERIRIGELDYKGAKRLLRQFDAQRRQVRRAARAAHQASEQSKAAGGHGGQLGPVFGKGSDNG